MTGRDLDGPLALHPLTYLVEGDEVTVGCERTASYAVLASDGAELIRRLGTGMTPNAAATWYAETYGEPVDLAEFLEALEELEFLADSDADAEAPATMAPVRWQALGRALFGPVAWVCYAALLVATVVAMIRVPAARPSYHNLFFSPYITVIEIVLFAGSIVALMIHEGFHALAGRRLGLRSTLGVGRRLHFVVFETRMDGLVAVPRRQRYLPILAGMLADVLVFATLTLGAVALRDRIPLAAGVLLALAFSTVLRLAWQFYFYLQTDLYYLVVTALGCVDLQKAAHRTLRNRFWRLLRRPDRVLDDTTWHPKDRDTARWYSWLLLAGYAFFAVTLVVAVLPAAWRVFGTILGRFTGAPEPWAAVADSVVFLTVNIVQFSAVAFMAVRARRRRRRETPLSHVLD